MHRGCFMHLLEILPKVTPTQAYRCCHTTRSTTFSQNLLSLSNNEQHQVQLHPTWLRENCRCAECYTHATYQRNVLTHKVTNEISSSKVEDDNLNITWADGHKSWYSMKWVLENSYPGQDESKCKRLWNNEIVKQYKLNSVDYKDLINTDDAVKQLLSNIWVYGFGLVEGCPATESDTRKATERVSFPLETFFGRYWTFTADLARGDTAYTNIALGAHTDSTYFNEPAGIQVFHCLQHDGRGGETLLLDGFFAAQQLREENPEAFNLLAETELEHEYREPGVHVRSLDSILKLHPVSQQLLRIRYNHYDRSPITTVPQHELSQLYSALNLLSSKVEDSQNEHWLKLHPGMVLFIDNWRVMHGRAAFSGKRTITGCYLPRDSWLSKARTLGVL